MPLLHILKQRCLYIKTHLRRALVPLFRTSNKPSAFKMTLSVEISRLRRNSSSLVSDYFFWGVRASVSCLYILVNKVVGN